MNKNNNIEKVNIKLPTKKKKKQCHNSHIWIDFDQSQHKHIPIRDDVLHNKFKEGLFVPSKNNPVQIIMFSNLINNLCEMNKYKFIVKICCIYLRVISCKKRMACCPPIVIEPYHYPAYFIVPVPIYNIYILCPVWQFHHLLGVLLVAWTFAKCALYT